MRNSNNLSQKIANEFENAGQNVRKYYQRRLPSNPSKDYYYIHRDTPNNETIIVEYGFADSKGDDVLQLKNNWEKLTEAVVKGVANYLGVAYKAPLSSDNDYYIVKSGDTLWSIARLYNISVDELKRLNNLTTNTISIGQKLLIKDTIMDNIYIVQKGDTLYAISKKYGVDINKLKSINNLTTNILSIGQKIIIPSFQKTYIVKKGDTLYSISKMFNTNVDTIKKINNLNTNNLSIGQVLSLPN